MRAKLLHLTFIALAIAVVARSASALCLDPTMQASGYRVPLVQEVKASESIVIGKVTGVRLLQEDPSDPEGVTATLYTVHVLRQLKGRQPADLFLRVDNDSGRYAMQAAEKHLLLLYRHQGELLVDSCGNSTVLPEGDGVLARVERTLRERSATAR